MGGRECQSITFFKHETFQVRGGRRWYILLFVHPQLCFLNDHLLVSITLLQRERKHRSQPVEHWSESTASDIFSITISLQVIEPPFCYSVSRTIIVQAYLWTGLANGVSGSTFPSKQKHGQEMSSTLEPSFVLLANITHAHPPAQHNVVRNSAGSGVQSTT